MYILFVSVTFLTPPFTLNSEAKQEESKLPEDGTEAVKRAHTEMGITTLLLIDISLRFLKDPKKIVDICICKIQSY